MYPVKYNLQMTVCPHAQFADFNYKMDRQPKNPVTQADKSRIMSSQSKNYGDGNIPSGSFGSRAQGAADKHTASGRTNK